MTAPISRLKTQPVTSQKTQGYPVDVLLAQLREKTGSSSNIISKDALVRLKKTKLLKNDPLYKVVSRILESPTPFKTPQAQKISNGLDLNVLKRIAGKDGKLTMKEWNTYEDTAGFSATW